jgi:hypothetical protein
MIKAGDKTVKVINKGGGSLGLVFFLAWIGAAVYFVQHSNGGSGVIVALLKSFVWPAYVVHAVLGLLHI